MMREKVAVVILNWNGCKMMADFLPSVVKYSVLPDVQVGVYVADNGSTDDSLTLLKEQFPTVGTILFDHNYGFAEGYNKALAAVDADYAVLLNSDVEVTPDWLVPMVAYMDAHPRTAGCQPKLMSWHRRDEYEYAGACGGYVDRFGYPFCRGRVFSTVEKDHGQYDKDESLLWATGACLMVRLDVYKEVGGLDGRFFAHMEEIDLCWRMRTRGYRMACVSDSVVYHVGGGTLNAGHPRKTFLNFRNNLLMLYKNLPQHELHRVLWMRFFLDYVAAFQFLLQGNASHTKAVFQARIAYHKLKKDFRASREENIRKAVAMDVPERKHYSILWKYYVKGKKRYADL